jgi:hypothetical protein
MIEAVRYKRNKPQFNGAFKWSDEPVWYKPADMQALFATVGLSNQGTLVRAFGHQTNVFIALPIFRNFYAHRSLGTKISINPLALGLPQLNHPSKILRFPFPQRQRPAISDWLSDLTIVADLLCN